MKNKPWFTAIRYFVFAISVCVVSTGNAQEKVPDTVPGKRFQQLLDILNEPNTERRNILIRDSFDDSEKDLDEVMAVAERLQAQFRGLSFQKVVENDDKQFYAVCLTKRGITIVAGVDVGGEKGLIKDVTIRLHEEKEDLKAVGDFFPIIVDGKSNPVCRGFWLAKGYGYLLEVTDSKLLAYNYSGNFGWEMDFEDNLLFKPGDSDKEAVVTFHPLEPGFNLTRLDSLPEACKKKEWTETELFDAFADVFTTHYPFFKERNVDWQERIKTHRLKVKDGMSESELFDVMNAMLSNLDDGHVSLNVEIDGKRRKADVGHTGTYKRLLDQFAKQTKYKTSGLFTNMFMRDMIGKIKAETIQGGANSECNDKLIWGRVHDNVGYIFITGMYGYDSGGMDKQVKSLHEGLNKILKELGDTDALIIDISLNQGGTDAISVEIARHFADKRRLGFSKWPAAVKDYRNDRYVTPYSESNDDAVMYTKPVYLLTGNISASAAEIFTMCMRAFPHVTTVGQPTEGALSDVLDKTLPNDWGLGISNEVYVDHEGICHEGPGVPPQIAIEIFDPSNVMNFVHTETIAKIVKLALKGTVPNKK